MKTITYVATCPFCKNQTHLTIDIEKFFEWNEDNTKIEKVFPWLPDNEKEILISGICNNCQEEIYREDEYTDPDSWGEDFSDCYNEDEGFDPFMGSYTWDV